MKTWRVNGTGANALSLSEGAVPTPGAGEVLVRMRAASINSRDQGILAGHYPNSPSVIPFSDGSGTVEAIGENVEEWAVGDDVVSCFYPRWESGPANAMNHAVSLGCEVDGVLSEFAVLPASALVTKPQSLTHAQAATLPCAGLTAWSALFTEGHLLAGQTVLVQGTGGVAIFALQFAKMMGARVILLSGDDLKAERARTMGADATINYRTQPDWSAQVLDLTNGRGADLILELGGQDTLAHSLNSVTVGGRIAIIGVLSGLSASIPIPPILFRHIHMTGITVGHRSDMRAMCAAIDLQEIRPVIDGHYSFDQAPDAYTALPQGRHFGKLVIDISA